MVSVYDRLQGPTESPSAPPALIVDESFHLVWRKSMFGCTPILFQFDPDPTNQAIPGSDASYEMMS